MTQWGFEWRSNPELAFACWPSGRGAADHRPSGRDDEFAICPHLKRALRREGVLFQQLQIWALSSRFGMIAC